jgi:tetratricopeptide (TPR) repeat protein
MWTLFDLGRWDEVLATGDALLDGGHGSSLLRAWAQTEQARVWVWRGDFAEAASLQADYLEALRETGDMQQLGPALTVAARSELARGNSVEAVRLVDEFIAGTEDIASNFRSLSLVDAIRLLLAAGEMDRAAAIADSSPPRGIRANISRDTAVAMVAEANGDTELALEQYEQVAKDWADYGHVLEHALALYGAGRCLLSLGRNDEAAARLGEAREILVDLGAAPTIAEINALGDQAAAL